MKSALLILSSALLSSVAFAQATNEFLNAQLLEASQPYINVPFEDDPGQAMTLNGFTVYRPNHGIVQGARVAALQQDVVRTVLASPKKTELQDWLQAKLSKDPEFMKKMSLMAVAHRAGRTDESDSITEPGKRDKELASSVAKFEKAAAKSGLHFTPQELKDFGAGIRLDGNDDSSSADQRNLTRILRAAHVFDLVRLGWRREQDIPSLLPELSSAETKALFDKAGKYVSLTHGNSHDLEFVNFSRDMNLLSRTLNAASGGTSSYKAANCRASDQPGKGKYQAVVKIQSQTASGDPAVQFVRVHPAKSSATDAELFELAKVSSLGAAKVTKTVVHGATKDDLSSLIDANVCQTWAKSGGGVATPAKPTGKAVK